MVQTTFLYYLTRVAHYQSLSIAAEELHVSQPALSQGIKTLEKQLGAKLLERTYKGVTLTPEGKEVVALAESAFAYLDKIETLYQQPDKKENADINDLMIYCNPAYSPLVMSALSANNSSEKKVIQIFDLTPDIDTRKLIHENKNAVILGIVPDLYNLSDDIYTIKLRTSRAYIMCTPDFPYIPANKSTISFKELAHVPLALLKNSFVFQKTLLKSIEQYGTPNIKVLSPNTNTVTSAVQNGVAAGFSNKFFSSPVDDNLRFLSIRNAPKFHLSLTAYCETNKSKVEKLAEIIKQQLY